MGEPWESLRQLGIILLRLLGELGGFLFAWSLLIAWIAWWLWGVNWKKAWPVLAQGAWVPVVLLMVVGALVWSRITPEPCECLRVVTIPNFWWQLGGVSTLAAIALFCGWVQGVLGWAPADIDLAPPLPGQVPTHGHEHPIGTLHGHDFAHADEPQR